MKRRFAALFLSAIMMIGSVTGCGSTNGSDGGEGAVNNNSEISADSNSEKEAPSEIVVNTVYGDVEVPYAPLRICVLDMDTMDMIHTFGLGDKVVSLAYNKKHTPYLADYYASETIVSLTTSTRNQEEGADPYEAYYSIDADLIIGTSEVVDENVYAVLSQIAPTVVLPSTEECKDGMYEGVMANAAVIASIWGLEEEFTSMRASYDDMYAQLKEVCSGKTYILGAGDVDVNSFRLATNSSSDKSGNSEKTEESDSTEKSNRSEGAGTSDSTENTDRSEKNSESGSTEKSGESGSSDHDKKSNTTAIIAFLTELGMVNKTEAAPEHVQTAALEGLDNETAARQLMDWIESENPDGLFITQRNYETYEEVIEAGYEYLYLDTLTVYQNNGFALLGTEWTQLSGGLTAMMTMVDQLAEAFLNN